MRVALIVILAVGIGGASAAHAAKPYDLNGDGRQDLVVGLPGWANKADEEVGAIVAFGSKRRMVGEPRELTREALGIPARSDGDAGLGASLASGDFDRDGRADLALGVPMLERFRSRFRGAVAIVYGGRRLPGRTTLLRDPRPESRLLLGHYLVAGDLRRDGFADLVLGLPEIEVLPGGKGGLSMDDGFPIARPPGGDSGDSTSSFAFGDTTRGGGPELFEGAPGSDIHYAPEYPGHLIGAFDRARQARSVAEDMRGGPDSLAIGDVDGDGYRDLVAGIRHNFFRDEDEPCSPGAVQIWRGSRDGLAEVPLTLTQDSPGVPGANEECDAFGASVQVGKLDADRYADIVVGAPWDDEPGADTYQQAGRVTIIRGGRRGYDRRGNRAFGFSTRGVPGSVSRDDALFGLSTSLLDFNGDRRLDLAVSDAMLPPGAGVTIFRGARRGISLRRARRITYREASVVPKSGLQGSPDFPRLGRSGSTR